MHFQKRAKKFILAAADTFRAAAIEQLEIWADRSKCEIIKQKEGSDPAAVIYDAISAAKARHADVISVILRADFITKSTLWMSLQKSTA